MKIAATLKWTLKTSLLIFLINPSVGWTGASDRGGGNGFFTTRKEIENAVLYRQEFDPNGHEGVKYFGLARDANTLLFKAFAFQFFNPSSIADNDIKKVVSEIIKISMRQNDSEITQKFLNYNQQLLAVMGSLPNSLVVKDKCLDKNGKEVDSSTPYQIKSEVCFSGTRLTRYPADELPFQLLGLYFHEVAHQFGIEDEGLAEKFQAYIVGVARKLKDIDMWSFRWVAGLGGEIKNFEMNEISLGGEITLTDVSGKPFTLICQNRKDRLNAKEMELGTMMITPGSFFRWTQQKTRDDKTTYTIEREIFCHDFDIPKCGVSDYLNKAGRQLITLGSLPLINGTPEEVVGLLAKLKKANLCK